MRLRGVVTFFTTWWTKKRKMQLVLSKEMFICRDRQNEKLFTLNTVNLPAFSWTSSFWLYVSSLWFLYSLLSLFYHQKLSFSFWPSCVFLQKITNYNCDKADIKPNCIISFLLLPTANIIRQTKSERRFLFCICNLLVLAGARGVKSRTYTAVLRPATTALMVSSSHDDSIR